jgi:hypothetical protein
MQMKLWLILLLAGIWFTTAACGADAPATPSPPAISTGASSVTVMPDTPTSLPVTQEAVAASTNAAPPEVVPAAESVDWLTVEGKTADNLPYRGNPDAPVTLIDYSDFL